MCIMGATLSAMGMFRNVGEGYDGKCGYVFSVLQGVQYCGGYPACAGGGILCIMGDILSTVGMFSIAGRHGEKRGGTEHPTWY